MEEFVEKFEQFREFLNSDATMHMVDSMLGERGSGVLKIIRDKFDELGLNDAF